MTYDYNAVDDLTEVNSWLGSRTYAYSANSQMVEFTNLLGQTFSYSYDSNGNLTELTSPDGVITEYDYNKRDLAKSMTFDGIRTFTFQYDDRGSVVQKTYPNDITTSYQYNDLGNLTRLAHLTSTGDTVSGYRYDYSTLQNITRIESDSGPVTEYEYDKGSWLTKEVRKDASGGTVYGTAYACDAMGNRVADTDLESGNVTNYNYGSDNRLLSAGGDTFSYDLAGRIKERHTDSGTFQYNWNARGRLEQVTRPSGTTVDFTYRSDGKRFKRVGPSVTKKYFWNAMNENVWAEQDGSGSQIVKYGQALSMDVNLFQK